MSSNITTVTLPTGVMNVRVDSSELPLDALCGFAARRNPKRGFLFVSKVLGKHIPVRPSLVREVHARLARHIPEGLPGPVVVIGMAETAIALGHGVHDEYVRQSGREDVLFIHSTRYKNNRAPVLLEFKEEHSHATDHLIFRPHDPDHARMLRGARSVVLVDDEASTGKTFVNLAREMKGVLPKLEEVVTVVITDWRGPDRLANTHAQIPLPCTSVSVLQGEYNFSPAPDLVAVQMPAVHGNDGAKDEYIRSNFGRFGLQGPLTIQDVLHGELPRNLGNRLLVLGTGEFLYPPLLLAEALENAGHQVWYQSTTRSPIMEGLAIGHSLTFLDNYGDGIPNFIYNARPEPYDRVLLCHETPEWSLDPNMLSALSATPVQFVR